MGGGVEGVVDGVFEGVHGMDLGSVGDGPETWLYLLSFEDGGRGLLIGVAVVFIISCTAGFCSTQMFVDQIDPWSAFQG